MTANEYYIDQHAPIYVQNKTLDVTTSGITLVAEDSESECIIFRIEKTYDGISALDPSKIIYVDYIPANLNAETEKVSFYSDKILSRSEVEMDGKVYIDLKWIVPYNAVRAAGKLTIALAILGQSTSIDHEGNQIPYLWQSLPAVLTVRPNIALRHDIKITPEQTATLESVNAQVQRIQEFVDDIDNVSNINTETGEITYTTRENGTSSTETISVADLMIQDFVDEEIILSGGGAPVEEEE